MKRRITRGSIFALGRRGFLGGALAGGLCLVAARGRRGWWGADGGAEGGADVGADVGSRASAAARRRGRVRAAKPWATLREEVISPDELEPSGDDLAG